MRVVGALALVAALACGDSGGAAADAARADDGALCEPFADRACQAGSSFWTDSCGNLGELAEECSGPTFCAEERGLCCRQQGATDTFGGGPHTTTLALTHRSAAIEGRWSLRLDQVDYDVNARGQRLTWRPSIDGERARFGFTTHLASGADYLSFGLELWREGSILLTDSEPGPAATEEIEGTHLAVRAEIPTSTQTLDFRLVREEADGEADWFALYVSIDGGAEALHGRVRFTRAAIGVRATIAPSSSASIQVTKPDPEIFTILDLPVFRVSTSVPELGGEAAESGVVDYGTVSSPVFVGSELTYDRETAELRWVEGNGTIRCNDEGELL